VPDEFIVRREYEERVGQVDVKLAQLTQMVIDAEKDTIETRRILVQLEHQVTESLGDVKVMLVRFQAVEAKFEDLKKEVVASGKKQLVLLGFGLTAMNIVATAIIAILRL